MKGQVEVKVSLFQPISLEFVERQLLSNFHIFQTKYFVTAGQHASLVSFCFVLNAFPCLHSSFPLF